MKRDDLGRFQKGTHWRQKSPLWDKEWLEEQYLVKMRSMQDIAKELLVSEPAVRHWIKKHNIKSRSISDSRKAKHWGLCGSDNPMWNKKGELNPNWKGGMTPDRQSFYQSQGWKTVCAEVWKRDNASCVRCGLSKSECEDIPFHVHHIKSFCESIESRADINNLLLVCEICHHWIHSKKNTNREYLK